MLVFQHEHGEVSAQRSIVYFAYLGDGDAEDGVVQRRFTFMERQLRWLLALVGMMPERMDVLVSYVAPLAWDARILHAVSRCGFGIDPDWVDADRRNRFEYRGFMAMRALARSRGPEHLIFYCHSKGIVHLEEQKMGLFRLHTEACLTADLGLLANNPALTRAGLFPYRFGWCWYNFFWIKAGLMSALAVEESADRYHFEALIGDRADKQGYRGVVSLIDQLPFAATGILPQPWYRPEETVTATLVDSYDRYARLASPAAIPLAHVGR